MTKGYEVRAQIDSENTRGLLLINGGAAVALLAFLPAIFGKPGLGSLVAATLWAAWLISVRTSVRGYPQPSAPNLLVSSGGASVQAVPMPLPANLGSMDKSRAVRVCAKHVLLTVIAR